MEDLSKQIKKLDLKQNAVKILINSIYGAFGNKWFYFYNPDIAQSITLQGQDLIKFSIKAVNHYFREKWHTDTELHEILGISGRKISKIEEDAAIYTDTDSIYVQFDSALISVDGLLSEIDNERALQICVLIDHHRLASYFNLCFEKYGKHFNTKNRLKLKLENLSETGIWLKKKNYAIKVSYEPNSELKLIPQEKRYLVIKGLEPVKSSYPIWARNHLKKLTEFILEKGKTLNIEEDLMPKLQKLKDEFLKLSIDDIAFNFKVRIYNKYVEDEAALKLKKGISIYPRAAAYQNYLLIKTGLDKKYVKIREGDKIKFYYCANNNYGFDVFAYSPENYPVEIAPPIDRELQFFGLIVEPINRQLTAMKMSSLTSNLKRHVDKITPKSKKPITDDQLYPLYVVDRESLEYIEVPEKFWKTIGNPDADISDEDYDEYIATITKYGLNTSIVPKFELPKYLKRLSKKQEKEAEKQAKLEFEEDED